MRSPDGEGPILSSARRGGESPSRWLVMTSSRTRRKMSRATSSPSHMRPTTPPSLGSTPNAVYMAIAVPVPIGPMLAPRLFPCQGALPAGAYANARSIDAPALVQETARVKEFTERRAMLEGERRERKSGAEVPCCGGDRGTASRVTPMLPQPCHNRGQDLQQSFHLGQGIPGAEAQAHRSLQPLV
jgi:hypothetical protein